MPHLFHSASINKQHHADTSLPYSSVAKGTPADASDVGSGRGPQRSLEKKMTPHSSILAGNHIDRRACQATINRVTESQT